jgi:hypothetical protein
MTSTVSGLALVATALTSTLSASAASEFLPYAEVLADNAVISTQASESGYRLTSSITRGELAKIAVNLAGLTPTDCDMGTFSDVTTSNSLCGYVEAAADADIVSSSFAKFRPSDLVTRAEMTKMLLSAVGESGSSASAGYSDTSANMGDLYAFINRANELGCARTATYFRPMANSSRGEAFKIASCIAYGNATTPVVVVPPAPVATGTVSTGTVVTPVVASGALSASLVGTAMALYVPMNASSVNVGTVTLTAGTTPVTVTSLRVTRSGLGNAGDVSSIRAASNGAIVSSSADYYNATSQAGMIYFSPAMVIPAGTSKSVDILVNLNGLQNSQHQFTLTQINAANAVVSGAPVSMGFLNTTSYLTTTTTAMVYNGMSSLTPGQINQTFAKVDITAGSRDTKTVGFVLTRSGGTNLPDRLANVKVYRAGVEVGTATVSNDKVVVSGLSSTLLAGNTETYELKSDILVSNNGTFQLKFDSTTDVSATEVSTGYATQVAASGLATLAFNNVQVTFNKTTTASQTVPPGTNNVVLFKGQLSSQVPLTVRQLTINTSGTNGGIGTFVSSNLTVKVNGQNVGTLTSLTGAQVIPVSFQVDSTSPAVIEIGGNVVSTVTGTNTYTFSVALTDVRDMNNNTATVGVGSSTAGDLTTIAVARLDVKQATVAAPTTTRLFPGAEQEIGRLALTASNEDVRVDSLVFNNVATTPASITGIALSTSSVKLVDVSNNAVVANGTINTTNGNIEFTNMSNVSVVKDVTKNYKVVLYVSSSATANYGQNVKLGYVSGMFYRTLNGAAVTPTVLATNMKNYTIGVVPPTVMVSTTSTPSKFKVVITNVDTNTGMTISGVTLKVLSRLAGNNNSFSGSVCLADAGAAIINCGNTGSTAGASISSSSVTASFMLPGGLAGSNMASNTNGTVEFDVFLDGNILFIPGDYTQVNVTSIDYTAGGVNSIEGYVGVTGATATKAF